ncbi:FAD-dependent oxidoreductase [Halarcobacter mediterraneus]|uniref:FAD-dependent oxidoreductase n=1 Tax=Halarcobacter mediterraneus TaxID=2023153 RepID=A0A4Q1AVU5_9BACT|nr:FAD-dependent oxidoreductase [Halarcobacter mediterraneus]RXK12072.1 FAD-dependent oxidoreductase [Halarcobacter mediterraneus]
MKRDIVIIGGGVVGLMCAYNLFKQGRQVTLIDEHTIEDSTSFGNAGLLSAFDKTPLSYPGIVTNTLKLMIKGQSPVIFHPTLDLKLYKWLYQFVQSANETRTKKTMMLFEKYGQISIDIYKDLVYNVGIDFDFHHKGMLSVFTQKNTYEDKLEKYNYIDENRFEIFNKEKIKEYLPFSNNKIKGAILFKKNAHIDPGKLMLGLKKYLQDSGVEFILNEKIVDIKYDNKKIKSVSSKNTEYKADTFIMSTGYKTSLARKLNKNLILTPAKGYSITFSMPKELKPKTSTLFNDLFIVMTPRFNDVRLTSKLELGSNNKEVVKKQIESIKKNFKEYSIPFEMKNEKLWSGFRPLTPNDIPLIGRDETYSNLVYAMGLGWLGMTFSPAVGKTISDLIVKNQSNSKNDDILLFSGFYQ